MSGRPAVTSAVTSAVSERDLHVQTLAEGQLAPAALLTAASVHRNMVPSNLIEATFQQVGRSRTRSEPGQNRPPSNHLSAPQYKTDLLPVLKVPARTVQPSFVYVVPDESDPNGRTVYLELTPPPEVIYRTSPGSSQQMNVLGIVVFSATMGESVQGSEVRGQGSGVRGPPTGTSKRLCWCSCRSAPGPDGRARSSSGQRVSVHQRVRDEDHQRRRLVRRLLLCRAPPTAPPTSGPRGKSLDFHQVPYLGTGRWGGLGAELAISTGSHP